MQACGNIPPINIKNKGEWINIERLRWAKQFNIPICEKVCSSFHPSVSFLVLLAAVNLSANVSW